MRDGRLVVEGRASIGRRAGVLGSRALVVALSVLVLAPEVFQPLRQVVLHFHASTDGVTFRSATWLTTARAA